MNMCHDVDILGMMVRRLSWMKTATFKANMSQAHEEALFSKLRCVARAVQSLHKRPQCNVRTTVTLFNLEKQQIHPTPRNDAEENVSKKARVARNVLHIRGEDELKLEVNEEAWPNADLAIRSSYEGALIDGLPADKDKAGDEREITRDEGSAAVLLGQGGRRTSWQIHLAHRLGTPDERKRSEIAMCLGGLRDNGER